MAAYNIESPQFSFIQFGAVAAVDACCNSYAFAVPVAEENDTWFQVSLFGDNQTHADDLAELPIENFELLLLSGTENTSGTYAANTIRNWTAADGLKFTRQRTGTLRITLLWKQNFKDIKTLVGCDVCFQLALKVTFLDDTATIVSFSNPLKRICETCDTSVLEYTNEENAHGFYYCSLFGSVNRIRLPLLFKNPQYIDEESVYIKSDGSRKVTKALSFKEFVAEVDFVPEWVHDKIKAALSHDYKSIISSRYNGVFSKNGSYELQWDDDLCEAPATFKANTSPYSFKNSNCAECTTPDQMVLANDLYPETLLEGSTTNINCKTNDQVYCSPFTYSILSTNPAYVQSANITAAGVLTVTLKATLLSASNVLLVTYKVTCADGSYKTALVRATVSGTGSAPACENVTDAVIESVGYNKIAVNATPVSGSLGYIIRVTGTYGFMDYPVTAFPTVLLGIAAGVYDVSIITECSAGVFSSGTAAVSVTVIDPIGGGSGEECYCFDEPAVYTVVPGGLCNDGTDAICS